MGEALFAAALAVAAALIVAGVAVIAGAGPALIAAGVVSAGWVWAVKD